MRRRHSTATAIWRKRGATKQNKRGQHTPENATELTMTTSRAAVEGRALLSDMLRCATLSMLALASQASRRHVSPPLGAPHNHSRRATPCMGQMSMRSSRASTGQPRIPRLIRNTHRIPRHKWCSTEPLLSALPALLGVTDTGTGPRCQGLPSTAEAGLRTDVEADMYRCGSQRRCCERR